MISILVILGALLVYWLLVGGQRLNNFVSGHRCPAQFQLSGGVLTTLQIKGQSLDEDGLIFDVTHTGSGGRTARIAGKADHKGTINADFDLDVPPYLNPPGIRFGSTGIILFFFSPSRPIQIPVIVSKVHYESAIESEVKYSFDVQENVLVGVIVYPAVAG